MRNLGSGAIASSDELSISKVVRENVLIDRLPDQKTVENIRNQLEPVNRERLNMLDDALRKAKGEPVPLAEIIDAMVVPMAKRFVVSAKGEKLFNSELSRWFAQSAATKLKVNREVFAVAAGRFLHEVQRALPEVLAEEIPRRFYMATSAMLGGLMRLDQFLDLSPDKLNEPVIWETIKELKEFICEGLGRPMPKVDRDQIILHQGNRPRVVDTQAICSIRADDNYTHVNFWGGVKCYVRRKRRKWELLLSSDLFSRIHRNAIINRVHISEIERLSDERLRIQLQGEHEPHYVSRRRAPKVKKMLEL